MTHQELAQFIADTRTEASKAETDALRQADNLARQARRDEDRLLHAGLIRLAARAVTYAAPGDIAAQNRYLAGYAGVDTDDAIGIVKRLRARFAYLEEPVKGSGVR